MNNYPIFYFHCDTNDRFNSKQGTCLLSSNYKNGLLIKNTPTERIRRSLALFCARSLPLYTWDKSTDVFIWRSNDE